MKKLLAPLTVLAMATLPALAEEASVLLDSPGLRPMRDPSIVIPAGYQYPNRAPDLPDYRDHTGQPKPGWVEVVVKTRRFFSNRSARVFYRSRDLAGSSTFTPAGSSRKMRIWPLGTLFVLETYDGDGSMRKDTSPLEIAVMEKRRRGGTDHSPVYYPMAWSYARYKADGEPLLSPDEVKDCHRCHGIAFHLTGDLIFTQIP